MAELQERPLELDEVRDLLPELEVPFAKALSVFLRELSKSVSHRRRRGGGGRASLGPLQAIDEIDPPLRDELNALMDAYESAAAAGRQETMEFTADSPAEAAAHRLRRAARKQGVSQKQLAERLNVTPAVISRVFKNPDRSKLATIRRIAQALGVELHEIV